MPNDNSSLFAMSTPAEIAFPPALYEKRLASPRAKEPRWELALLMAPDHPDLKAIKDFCKRVAEFNQPGITASPTAWKYPWSSTAGYIAKKAQDDAAFDNSRLEGMVFLNSHSTKFEPKLSIIVPNRDPPVVDHWTPDARLLIKDRFFAGAMVFCEFSFAWYPANNGLPGVTAYLNKVCATGEGKRRGGGGRSGQETWGAYVGNAGAAVASADEY